MLLPYFVVGSHVNPYRGNLLSFSFGVRLIFTILLRKLEKEREREKKKKLPLTCLQWGTADAKIKDPFVENPEFKGSPF